MPPHINHVIVLMLENRSFDHLLGFLQRDYPPGVFHGLSGTETNPDAAGVPVRVSDTAAATLDVDPDHSHSGVMLQLTGMKSPPPHAPLTNDGFVRAYADKSRGNGHDAMRCFAPSHVPVLSGLARAFAVCDRWFCSVPGETWPNRNYVHAATSDGEVNINKRFYKNRTIFELLEAAGHEWAVYHRGPAQVWAFPRLWESPFSRTKRFRPLDTLAADIRNGNIPSYTFVEPDHGLLVPKHQSNSQHPGNNTRDGRDFFAGEQLILDVYAACVANPAVWNSTLLVVSYDEHGGFYDATAPPRGAPPAVAPDDVSHTGFTFDLLGVRVPTVLISPWIPAGTVDSTVYDHSAVPASLRERFAPAAAPLTKRDAVSQRFWSTLSAPQPRPLADIPDPTEMQSQLDQTTALVTRSAGAAPAPEQAKPLDDFQQSLLEITMRVDTVLRTHADPFTVDAVTATLTPLAAQPLERNPPARIAYLENVERRFREGSQ